MALKRAWITPQEGNLVSLSFESETVIPEYMRVKVKEVVFPVNPTKEKPLRHTICLKLFTLQDLITLRETIDDYVYSQYKEDDL